MRILAFLMTVVIERLVSELIGVALAMLLA